MSGEAYHLIPLGLAILFFYALGLVMVRFGVFSRRQNRRFWNFLLLFFFSSTAILGLLLVVKVNYKLEIPWIEEALQWHVDCGIGLALVSLFHLFSGHMDAPHRHGGPGRYSAPWTHFTPRAVQAASVSGPHSAMHIYAVDP